ncbi:rho guanine nucleotide exchange factor 2-like isoform X2 [Narcine bancroftii]|uniref:rho guanine nucleotide exchange factor 2-like isoform X2 n=1 Tax=Narcine bancroftii TaxID=1343680 RepID=UPI0038322E1D
MNRADRSRQVANKNKEREKLKERETRITNGHLFTSITISGNTLCFACNKSIIAKEAFFCSNCIVTIHKSCKDVLASCTKVKQKLKAAQAKNNSVLQNVSMRHKASLGRERPNSAVYPSDSLRQSPLFSQLGSRRARTPFQSLSKSVSTNNIGNLNDETTLGIRKILSHSTESLNMKTRTLSIESLVDERAETIYSQLMGDLETDEKDFEADSWSLAVDTSFLQMHRKDVMKRQDVIYELIQTEVHHVRTLKIMSDIFRKGMVEDLQMESSTVYAMFPALDELLDFHAHFLSRLLERRRDSLLGGSHTNFVITRLGDLLVSEFSGKNAELLKKAYMEFCSRHTKAVKLYKELFTRDKRFQQFVRRMARCSVLRRHGIQECILLVTQRITKYPVLFDRILQNTKGDEEEQRDLGRALALMKEVIVAVDTEVHECERRCRLQEVCSRMDPRAAATMHSGRSFQCEDLARRRLVHDGFVLWKTSTGRFKDVQVLLLTDVLIFLQEKDQRYSFPVLDNKPAVIPLQKLIVRDIANQEKGMFLISAAAPVPEMYEIHMASREDRSTWIRIIQRTVSICPEVELFSMEIQTREELRELSDEIQQRDRRVSELLEEKAGLLRRMLQLRSGEDLTPGPIPRRLLLPPDPSDHPQGERLVVEAMREVQSLSELIVNAYVNPCTSVDQSPGNFIPTGTEKTSGPGLSSPETELPSVNGSVELSRSQSLMDTARDRNGNQLKPYNEEVLQRLSQLSTLLLTLQAVAVKQDTVLEEQRQQLSELNQRASRPGAKESPQPELERLRGLEKESEELAGLRRQHGLLQVEFQRSRRTCEERAEELRALEARLRDSEKRRELLESERDARPPAGPGMEACPAAVLRPKRKVHSRQFSLPAGPISCLNTSTAQPLPAAQRRKSADELCLGLWSDPPEEPCTPQEVGEGLERRLAPRVGQQTEEDVPEEEEEGGSESPSTSSGEEAAGAEQLQKFPEDAVSDPDPPASGDEEPTSQPQLTLNPAAEEDDDDEYY